MAIKALVLSHRLPPSTFLNIKTIARVLKLSQTPVREALARLVHEGLVLQAPSGRGYFCRPIRIDELASEYEAAFLIARYSLRERHDLVIAQRISWDPAVARDASTDIADLRIHKIERFYRQLGDLSQNLRLQHVMENFIERTHFIRRHDLLSAGEADDVGQFFQDVVRLIEVEDTEAAVERLRVETGRMIERLPELIQQILRIADSSGLSIEAALTSNAEVR